MCRWYCEMPFALDAPLSGFRCRLLASNAAGEDFSTAEVASALTAQHMQRFLHFQAEGSLLSGDASGFQSAKEMMAFTGAI